MTTNEVTTHWNKDGTWMQAPSQTNQEPGL